MWFDFNSYTTWLILVSLFCVLLERVKPWRKQKLFRPQLAQDFFWLAFNGYYLAVLFAPLFNWAVGLTGDLFQSAGLARPETLNWINSWPFWAQVLILLFLQDFIEWTVHNLLHRVSWLWQFHKLHHSIHIMDWIGNFRFHWVEVLVYKSLKYLPLAILGFNGEAVLLVAVFATLIGHLNHSNVPFDYGPLKYILNSPKMHIWHHDTILHMKGGQNFGIVFSIWDWVFGTAYMPAGQPERIGFEDDNKFPDNFFLRFIWPLGNLIKR